MPENQKTTKPTATDGQTILTLNSFVRRTQDTQELKHYVACSGARLVRLGRSRNWQLHASTKQLRQIIHLAEARQEPSWNWLLTLLRDSSPAFSDAELLALAKQLPDITVQQLVQQTDCSLLQARQTIDRLEWQEESPSVGEQ